MIYRIIILFLFLLEIQLVFNRKPTMNSNKNSMRGGCKRPDFARKHKQGENIFDIELRATILKCQQVSQMSTRKHVTKSKQEKRKKGRICEEEKDTGPFNLKCNQKLSAVLKITSKGQTTDYNQFIIIDHVIHVGTGERASLLHPYVVVLRQKPVMQLYGLRYKNIVNAEAKELVVAKRNSNMKTCNDGRINPACGVVKYKGKLVPFSQGFSCSCDENFHDNKRYSRSENSSNSFDFQSFVKTLSNTKSKGFTDQENRIYSKNLRPARHPNHFVRVRGGEDCEETSSNEDQTRFKHKSNKNTAHCLRFSNLWYADYQLSQPIADHSLFMRIFEKRELLDGRTKWIDLTLGKTIHIGTNNKVYHDKQNTILVSYDNPQKEGSFSLDSRNKRLLIPYTPSADPSEFLVVDANDIDASGEQCDKIGVGYSAFYNQPNRCYISKGSCLGNQPRHLYRQDKLADKEGRKGKYLLKNYADIPKDAVRVTDNNNQYLALNFHNKYVSNINIELTADDNIIFRSASQAKITEVYIENTDDSVTLLTIKIYNNALTSNIFRPRLTDCPMELPVDWGNLEGESVVIPPQQQTVFKLRLVGSLNVQNFYCSVEALNAKNEIIAVRRVRVVKGDRCICAWHCLCACFLKTGLGCCPMTLENYKAAGFIGSMPMTKNMVQVTTLERILFSCAFFIALSFIILLLMGLTKGLIGFCCYVPVGIWGFDLIVRMNRLCRYHEKSLRNRNVVYDEEGWPVHPDTQQRTVRVVDKKVEFCLNLVFFFTYPVMLLFTLCLKICCPYYSYAGDEDKNAQFEAVSTVIFSKCTEKRSSDEDCTQFDFDNFDSMVSLKETR